MRLMGRESFACPCTCRGELTRVLPVCDAAGLQIVTDGVGAALTSHNGATGTVTSSVALATALAELVLTTVIRCVPPVRATDVLSWLELTVNFKTPSRYNCMRLITFESFACAITCVGELTAALLAGVHMITDGVGAEVRSQVGGGGAGTETVIELLKNTPSESRAF